MPCHATHLSISAAKSTKCLLQKYMTKIFQSGCLQNLLQNKKKEEIKE